MLESVPSQKLKQRENFLALPPSPGPTWPGFMLMAPLKRIFEMYASIGIDKKEVIREYVKLKLKIASETGLKGGELERKVHRTLEDKFLEILEGEIHEYNTKS